MSSSDLSATTMSRSSFDASSPLVWKFALLICALIWGGSFVVIKDAISYISAAWLMTLRFVFAVGIVAIIFRKNLAEHLDATHIKYGVLLGILNGLGYLFQNGALAYTTAGKAAFIASIYCAMIPFVNWLIAKKKPHSTSIFAAFMCVAGVGLISLGADFSFSFGLGEQMTLLSAVIFAFDFLLTRFALKRFPILQYCPQMLGLPSPTSLSSRPR